MAQRVNKKAQKAFLESYDNALGNISAACRAVGISRRTFYDWKEDNPSFAEKVKEIDEKNVDFAESMLLKNIREGKETSLIFFLKTKGKDRGYIETSEVNANVTGVELRPLTDEELDELKMLNRERTGK